MTFTLATWNINSVRLRMPLVERFLRSYQPDVLCLQETKCPDDLFPFEPLRAAGYEHIAIHGQKGYHGVATISRRPLEIVEKRRFCEIDDTRHLSVKLNAAGKTVLLHNFYVPAGGDEPDPEINPKFKHKLGFIDEMNGVRAGFDGESASILVGDLNIAPLEHDVWSHKQLLNVVSHTPIETAGLEAMRTGGGWADLMRHDVPYEQKLYTWWSYRAQDWAASDRGRRLDHIWSSPNMIGNLAEIEILREARGWDRPSDHVPVIMRMTD
ncbi:MULTISPECIES: exodeoxyribonuclease III [Mesorhizobium]|uniref:Exodeoxyribonuclease III n=1 Tax=Mesorhizobium denitrificans TaxID=2294114 RepID=A0A371XH08_9HYPH|nr:MULTISPECIES: exodeoxyribonuclease III [Mesorhizobium]RFC68519.1 exodeoxyribonuclease III [Mesorhizobium denitrificans]